MIKSILLIIIPVNNFASYFLKNKCALQKNNSAKGNAANQKGEVVWVR